ncbi:copper chaperone CopZ [Saccharothrix tamanrassetensis]|uniref:Copper chaperone CopZ n=1 Tax=Saccharothrix tamanrassetensis TaxID=1051531 RepID=A0A841CQV0_9PSEU|nr:heavy metal-associated domain-containing protein [Saccharothrix tamanrassetensis]MBB5960101.1 copper chaperone CopZ [Saccharothrix tamanrassetensis]
MCSCSADTGPATGKSLAGRDFLVAGMTCGSCAAKVTTAVREVPGVTDVEIDLATGRLTVAGTAGDTDITAAVTGAGYSTSPA